MSVILRATALMKPSICCSEPGKVEWCWGGGGCACVCYVCASKGQSWFSLQHFSASANLKKKIFFLVAYVFFNKTVTQLQKVKVHFHYWIMNIRQHHTQVTPRTPHLFYSLLFSCSFLCPSHSPPPLSSQPLRFTFISFYKAMKHQAPA